MTVKLRRGTNEALHVQYTSDVDPTNDPVFFAIVETANADVPDDAWTAGSWHPTLTATAVTPLIGDTSDAELSIVGGKICYLVGKVTDSPEAPVDDCGSIWMP